MRVIFFLFISLSIQIAHANDTIIVAVNDTAPWKMVKDGKIEGIDINITNELASRLGLKVEYRALPLKRCLLSLRRGQADIMGFLTFKEERTEFLRYIQPPYQGDTKIFYVRLGEAQKLKNYEDLYNLNTGVILGHKHYEPFDSDKKIKKSYVNKIRSSYHMLAKGHVDAIIDNDTQGPYNAHRFGVADSIEIAPYKAKLEMNGYFAMSKKSKFITQIDKFDEVLKEMVESGTIDKIIQEGIKEYLPK